jgi:hypothetical protein
MMEKLKSVGYAVFGIALFLLIPLLIVLFLHGAAWVSDKVLPILSAVGAISFLLLILVGLPLSIFKKCRGWCGAVFVYWSYLCGLCLWMTSLLLTINFWGYIAAIIGLFLAGIGVFPIAVLACMFKGEWSLFFQLVLQFVILIAARIYGFYLAEKADREVAEERFNINLYGDPRQYETPEGKKVFEEIRARKEAQANAELFAAFKTLETTGHELTPGQQERFEKLKSEFEAPETQSPPASTEQDGTDEKGRLAAELKSLRDSLTTPFNKP